MVNPKKIINLKIRYISGTKTALEQPIIKVQKFYKVQSCTGTYEATLILHALFHQLTSLGDICSFLPERDGRLMY